MPSIEALDAQTRMLPETIAPSSLVLPEVINGVLVHKIVINDYFGLETQDQIRVEAWARLPRLLKKGPFGIPLPSWLARYLPKRLEEVQLAIQPKIDLTMQLKTESTSELRQVLIAHNVENPLIYEKPYVVMPHHPAEIEHGLRFLAPLNFQHKPFGKELLEKTETVRDQDNNRFQLWNSLHRLNTLSVLLRRNENLPTYRARFVDLHGLYQTVEGFWNLHWGGQDKPLDPPKQELWIREFIFEDTTKKNKNKNKKITHKLKFKDGNPRLMGGTLYTSTVEQIHYEYIQPIGENGKNGSSGAEKQATSTEDVSKSGVTEVNPLFSFEITYIQEDLKANPPIEFKTI